MDTRASASSASLEPPPPDLQPVAVTRWSARLADPQCERDYRVHRFPEDRRRALLLMGLVACASTLNFVIEVYAYLRGASGLAALVPAFTVIFFPIVGLAIVMRLCTPRILETFMVGAIAIGMTLRMLMVSLHPDVVEMGPAMMVGIVFVIYLYLPIRFVSSVVLAAGFTVFAPLWWRLALGAALPPDQFFRTLVWLLLANALGFVAANSLQRSLRMQFAQSLLLQQLLSTDSLTGIANRRRFDSALEREWRRCRRTGVPLSLLMIDVDHFKPYNDQLGHQQGDEALRQVARLLVDGVGRPGDLVARYGGEEFVCMLPENGMAPALAVANKLIEIIRYANIYHPRSPAGARLTISIGVATAKDLSGEPLALMALADKLLYAAKAAGRNQVIVGSLNPSKTGKSHKDAARAA
jgi:diguanylate cyclase (GGDEF)-like protein